MHVSSGYADWKAPQEDERVLIWPEAPRMLQDAAANFSALSHSELLIGDMPLRQLRQLARQFVGHATDSPLIMTGHQAELYHAGVWVKNAVIDAIASKLDGSAMHLSVDTDAPKHLQLRGPSLDAPISDDTNLASAAWTGLLESPTPAHLDALMRSLAIATASWGHEPLARSYLSSMKSLLLEQQVLPELIARTSHQSDWSLGLRHHVLMASPLWSSAPYLCFAAHLLRNAHSFAGSYNAALASYRAANGIKSKSRPIPDLFASEEAVEVPFWLDDLSSGTRTRPSVFRRDDGYVLELASGEEFVFRRDTGILQLGEELAAFLRKCAFRLSPRALMLTVFCRLVVADQFVHGIGGGRYDQVSDTIIASYFGMQPPRFAVATATMFFPGAMDQERVQWDRLLREGHHLRHAVLGDRKMQFVQQIAGLPRRGGERSRLFARMHDEIATAVQTDRSVAEWKRRVERARKQRSVERVIFDRELFYAIQPQSRLESTIARVKKAVSAAG